MRMSSMIWRATCGGCLISAAWSSKPSASSFTRRCAACAPPVPSRSASPSFVRDWISGGISSPGSSRSSRHSAPRCTAIVMNRAMMVNPIEIGALVALVDQDRLSEAEHKARALLRLHADAGMLWKILSVALVRQGKDALQALRRTSELMPQDAEAHCNLGAALYDQGQWAEALASLRRALVIQPDNVEALVDAANALRALRRAREAVPLYQQALKHDSRLIEAHNNLGNAFLELGLYEDAAGCYRLSLGIKPDDAQILCNLGNAQRQLGLFDEAIASSRRAIVLDPNSRLAP